MKIKGASVFSGLFILIGFTMLSGCAGYSITLDGDGHGYDVYKPEPYLLVKPAKDKVDAEIVWLPNYSQRYRIKTWNFLGKADFEFNIDDGWKLTKISDKSDNTTVPSKLLDVLQQTTKEGTVPLTGQAHLFRLVYNEKGEFIGLKLVPFID
jgi:hypothetical protein